MADVTPRLNLYKPADDGSEPVNVATDLNDNWEKLDTVIGAVPATSSTPPATTFDGMFRQNTDTDTLEYLKENSLWTQIWNKGVAFTGHALMTLGNKIGIGTLAPGAVLDAIVGSGTEIFARLRVGAEAQPRLQIDSTGMRIGPGGASVTDVRLYRGAANTLNITGNVVLENDLLVTGTPSFAGGFAVTDATVFDGDVNLNGGADIQDHMTFEGFPMMVGQRGQVTLPNVTAATSTSAAVSFGRTYPTAPTVFCNFNSTAGPTSGWSARAVNPTTTGFTAFLTGASSTFTSPIVTWVAFHEGV